MPDLPTIEKFLDIPGQTVELEDAGPSPPSDLSSHLAAAAPWLRLRATPNQAPRILTLRGSSPHGSIRFIGDLERRMIEPLVLTLRALATGHVDLDTPATPAFLEELSRDVKLRVIIGVACPYCPAATAVVLRLACVSPRVHVDVIRADLPDAPRVKAVPTLLDDTGEIVSGPVQEMKVVEAVLARHR